MIIVLLLLFFSLIGGLGFATYMVLKKTGMTGHREISPEDAVRSQDLLPFEKISDSVIDLGNHRYRAIIECSSVNFSLRTANEKEAIILSFKRFLDSLTFPISLYIQTKTIDEKKKMDKLKDELLVAINKFPNLEEYANHYYSDMATLSQRIGNNKQKKKYVIVGYDDAILLTELTEEEKRREGLKNLETRVAFIKSSLAGADVKTRRLNTAEIIEVLYVAYNKDSASYHENISTGEFSSLLVDSNESTFEATSDDAKVDWALFEAQKCIKNEVLSNDMPDFVKAEYENIVYELGKLRDSVGSHYEH